MMPPTSSSSDLNSELKRLVETACQHPPRSAQRRLHLNRLVRAIQRSGKLWRTDAAYYPDALQLAWQYLCLNLCEAGTGKQYDVDRASVITWLNAYLKYRLQDFGSAEWQQQRQQVQPILRDDSGSIRDIIAQLPADPDLPPILEETRRWVETDASGDLRATCVRGHPEVNCQILILRRLPPETPWKVLADDYQLPISTLANFYQRQCLPRLRAFGESQGYLDRS